MTSLNHRHKSIKKHPNKMSVTMKAIKSLTAEIREGLITKPNPQWEMKALCHVLYSWFAAHLQNSLILTSSFQLCSRQLLLHFNFTLDVGGEKKMWFKHPSHVNITKWLEGIRSIILIIGKLSHCLSHPFPLSYTLNGKVTPSSRRDAHYKQASKLKNCKHLNWYN